MKVKVTEKGVYDAKGERVPVGTVLSVKGDELPAYLVGKAVADGAQAVTNPAKTQKRLGLEKQATELQVGFTDETTDDELIEAIKAAKA